MHPQHNKGATFAATDLTVTGRIFIYVAIGNVVVSGTNISNTMAKLEQNHCRDPEIEITHVYVYIKDNYSFEDRKAQRNLNIWVIGTSMDLCSNAVRHLVMDQDYLITDGLDKPVDTNEVFKSSRARCLFPHLAEL